MNKDQLTDERRAAVLAFIKIYGNQWKTEMLKCHDGRPGYRARNLSHYIRQIRNYVTPNPDELEVLLYERKIS